jgi:hypothetical protein
MPMSSRRESKRAQERRPPQPSVKLVVMLKERGIGLVSLEEKIETNSAVDELVFRGFSSILVAGG